MRDRTKMRCRTFYCGICGKWFRAPAQEDIPHHHPGVESYLMLCKPAGFELGGGEYVGVKPIMSPRRVLCWRAMVISIESGYSETPSWGHEAGGWIHYRYYSMTDEHGNHIEGPSEANLVDRLKRMAGVRFSDYFKKQPIPNYTSEMESFEIMFEGRRR